MLQPLQPLVLSDFDREVFQTFVPPDHYVRKAKVVVDFERFRATCEDAYDAKTIGRPATDVVLMLKILSCAFTIGSRIAKWSYAPGGGRRLLRGLGAHPTRTRGDLAAEYRRA